MISRWTVAAALAFFTAVLALPARGGDAVAVGYNADGVWTSVTYYASGTPKGGADYKDEAGAREAAVRDLKTRAGEGIVTTRVIAASDWTAHVAYARGKSRGGQDAHAVGYGASKAEAEQDAFAQLSASGATRDRKVIYSYFSHGAAPLRQPAKSR